MNVVMMTNTFLPHVGGVARSVAAFSAEYRRRGHRVLVVAPEFPDVQANEVDVLRIPAIQNFNASDFSVALPLPSGLSEALDAFEPDIVHAHHPFLLGMSGLRAARARQLPLVFTHHTLYEQYTHYVPGDSPRLQRFAIELATAYANLCDQVFAPSNSIAELLHERGVTTPISEIPTGVQVKDFTRGDGRGFRHRMSIPADAFVVGHLGRLAPEKNLDFLARAVAEFLRIDSNSHFLVIGSGPSEADILEVFNTEGLAERLHLAGVLQATELADALHAMDVFAFASHSETQGMVLTEAMAAGVPVVALDAPGAREVVSDGINGRLLEHQQRTAFADALSWLAGRSPQQRDALTQAARTTANRFSLQHTAEKALSVYADTLTRSQGKPSIHDEDSENQALDRAINLIRAEWEIVKGMAEAGGTALTETDATGPERE
jgi:glycosyltransferase involved in cell wall biosynthesis